MTKQEAIQSLLDRFTPYGLTAQDASIIINQGISSGMSTEQAEIGARMALSSHYGVELYFSVKDVMIATGETEDAINAKIESISQELIKQGKNPLEFFPRVTTNPIFRKEN